MVLPKGACPMGCGLSRGRGSRELNGQDPGLRLPTRAGGRLSWLCTGAPCRERPCTPRSALLGGLGVTKLGFPSGRQCPGDIRSVQSDPGVGVL